MKKTRAFFLLIIALLSTFELEAQSSDSRANLEAKLKTNIHDTVRAKIYIDLAESIIEESEWVPYNRKALNLANKKLKTVSGSERLFFLRIKANAIGNLGYYEDDHGNIAKSISYYFESLKLYDQANDAAGKAVILGNLGIIYTDRGDYKEALDYLQQALDLKLKYNPKYVAKNYINIGVVLERLGDSLAGLEHYFLGLRAAEKIDDKIDMSTATNNIGSWYYARHDYMQAKPYLKQAIDFCLEEDDEPGAAWAMANIGICYVVLEKYDSSYYYLSKAKEIADYYQYPELSQTVAEKFYEHYVSVGDYKNALSSHVLSIEMRDSIENVDAQKSAIKQKLQYDHELETTANQLKRDEEKKREAQRFSFILIGLILAAVFAIIIYSRLRITKRQKNIIESQKQAVEYQNAIIEEKNEEIMDSINYAKRLQEAILPSIDSFRQSFSDYFLLYLPKDVVAGDFYWFYETEDFLYFAAADCTGHGVPGALVSVVCANALERSIKELPNASTNDLLDCVTKYVIQGFENEGSDVKDGMDIALGRVNKEKTTLQFSGAFNPCIIVRGNEIIELKADRRPVGNYINNNPFTSQDVPVHKDDWIYLYTDGYHDQFGGKDGKKYKSGAFKKLLCVNASLKGEEQELLLKSELDNWRGNLEQIDDVCVLGVKI